MVLCLGLNPNCSFGSKEELSTILLTLDRISFSTSLARESSKDMGRYEEGKDGFFPGLRIRTTTAFFH